MRFDLEEPPSINAMLTLASQARRKVVYHRERKRYQGRAMIDMRNQHQRPSEPWQTWRIVSAHFRLHNERDLLELDAGLKWGVDALVEAGYVVDDSPRHLLSVEPATQEIDRPNRGVTIVIQQVTP